ncbi:MAG: hypothetical protein QOE61_4452 [Micromonosporaceae bacterium]|jgi:hypothetical protein|nr:hypothetical protein [Micromonosporaceae bacterium]
MTVSVPHSVGITAVGSSPPAMELSSTELQDRVEAASGFAYASTDDTAVLA